MLLRGMRIEDGRIYLDGYPEGASVCGIGGQKAQELCRLVMFRGDLTAVLECLKAADALELQHQIRESLCDAALVRFCSCFEGTSGLRAKPLKQKKMFVSQDRKTLEKLRQIRNKLVAHNDHLYPGEFPLIVIDTDATAIEAVALKLDAPFSVMSEVGDLRRFAEIALGWVMAEFEATASAVVSDFNALPISERRRLRDNTTPEFKIVIGQAEDRF
jgi:hypothetical protein